MLDDFIVTRQCEEMSSDEELDAFNEAQLVPDELHTFNSADVYTIEKGLRADAIYRKLDNHLIPDGLRVAMIKQLANLLDQDLVERQKSWSAKDWEMWYRQSVNQYDAVPVEDTIF